MARPMTLYVCPECGKTSEGWKPGPRFCAGSQWMMERPFKPAQGDHPSVEMERVRVFHEEDVRALYDACYDASGNSLAPDTFPTPAEWA